MEGETHTLYCRRMMYYVRMNKVLSRYGLRVTEWKSPDLKPRHAFQKGFVSQCSQLFEDFVAFQ